MTAKVPNYNALSSLFDRLAIENIKLSYFENALEHDGLDADRTADYTSKADAQRRMIDVLKQDTVELLAEAIESGRYDFISEGRTFE